MRILLDECVPVQLKRALSGHQVESVRDLGWKGIRNGDLLRRAAEAGYEVLVLADKNLRYQQNLPRQGLALVELWTNHRPTLERHFPAIGQAITWVAPGEYLKICPPF